MYRSLPIPGELPTSTARSERTVMIKHHQYRKSGTTFMFRQGCRTLQHLLLKWGSGQEKGEQGVNEFQKAVTLKWLHSCSSSMLQAHTAECAWETAKHKTKQKKRARSPPGKFSLVSPAKMLTWMSFRINISRVICTQCCSVYLLITDLYTLSIIIECQDERQPKGLNAMFCHKENTAKVMAGAESRDTLGWKEIRAQYWGFFCRVLGFCF